MSNIEFCRLVIDPVNRRPVRQDTAHENTAADWCDDRETIGAVRVREIDPFDPPDPELGHEGGVGEWMNLGEAR